MFNKKHLQTLADLFKANSRMCNLFVRFATSFDTGVRGCTLGSVWRFHGLTVMRPQNSGVYAVTLTFWALSTMDVYGVTAKGDKLVDVVGQLLEQALGGEFFEWPRPYPVNPPEGRKVS